MSFSAMASFSAAAALLVIGSMTCRSARTASEYPFAAVPLLFAIQQSIEGVLWLSFSNEQPGLTAAMTYAFVLFSHVLWPVLMPLAVMLIEPPGPRRRALLAFVVAGVAVCAGLSVDIAQHGVVSRPSGHHIEYVMPYDLAKLGMSLYLLSTSMSLLVSSHRAVKAFGLLALLSFAITAFAYEIWLVSVWCYFAALLSIVVLGHFRPGLFRFGRFSRA
jgi:hypothetical protein